MDWSSFSNIFFTASFVLRFYGVGDLGSTNDYTAERFIKYGVLNVDIVNNGRTLKGTFYGNDGNIHDEFSIDK